MCSIIDSIPAPLTVPGFRRLVAHAQEAVTAIRDAIAADPSLLAELPDDALESLTLELHGTVDAASAVATVVTGRLEREVGGVRGKLVAGRYPSTARFLEKEGGLSPAAARAAVARGRDLDTHFTDVADSWLAGRISGGAVRDLTLGVTDVLRRCARTDTRLARREALAALLPLAEAGNLRDLARAVGELRLRVDPDGGTEEALHAYENQSLSLVAAGSMVRISGWLTPEVGAATATVLDRAARQITLEQVGEAEHDDDCETATDPADGCSCGAVDCARRQAGLSHDHLRARALGQVMTDRLGDATLGTHHRVAPHLTVVVDATDVTGPLLGRLALPGSDDDLVVPEATVHRLLCDSDVTRVLTAASCPQDGHELLRAASRSVLYVGRAERTAPPRLRRALEVRDRHCAFPGCRAHVRRCHAHHVLTWASGGRTDISSMALLCVAHHHAVHEGGWTMALRAGATGHEHGCWEFSPPEHRRRRP